LSITPTSSQKAIFRGDLNEHQCTMIFKLTIFNRLILSYIIILLVVISLGIYTTLKLRQLNQITHSISFIGDKSFATINRLKQTIITQRGFEKKYILTRDEDFYLQFQKTINYIKNDLEQIKLFADEVFVSKLLQDSIAVYSRYIKRVQDNVKNIHQDKESSLTKYQLKQDKLVKQIINKLEKISNIIKNDIDKKLKLSEKISSLASYIAALITIAAIIIAIFFAFYNSRTINRPLLSLILGTRMIAKGRFEEQIDISSPPEIKELAEAFNLMSVRLKKNDDLKSDFISSVSHDLRTPLAVIREAVSLHIENNPSESNDKGHKLLEIISEECERLIQSVNKILYLSRIDAGMMEYNLDKHSLKQLIERAIFNISPILEKKSITLALNINDNLPPVKVDDSKFGQLLDNIFGNAIKFTPDSGRITVTATERKDDFIEVSISDTGCGISEDQIAKIFDKFITLHNNGTGLGLYLAKRIIESHGGKIWASNNFQKGSTFSFTLPIF